VKLVIRESGSGAVGAAASGREMYSSRVAMVEVAKAVARHDPGADPTAVLGRVSWVELDEDLAGVASSAGGPRLRALDAIHVASALRVAPEIEAFVTYDARQAEVAAAAGFVVWSPLDDATS
jgi:predicted nucleic acid-binding protein